MNKKYLIPQFNSEGEKNEKLLWDLSDIRGNPVYSMKDSDKFYYYEDDTETGPDNIKPCVRCGHMPTADGHDFCLDTIPGIRNGCCGHGLNDPYLQFENGCLSEISGIYSWRINAHAYKLKYYDQAYILPPGERTYERYIKTVFTRNIINLFKIPADPDVDKDKEYNYFTPYQPLFSSTWKKEPPREIRFDYFNNYEALIRHSDIAKIFDKIADDIKVRYQDFVRLELPSIPQLMYICERLKKIKWQDRMGKCFTRNFYGTLPLSYDAGNEHINIHSPFMPLDVWPLFVFRKDF